MEMRSQSIYNRRSRSHCTAVGEYRLQSHAVSHIDPCVIRFIGNSMGSREMVLLALAIASAFPFLSTTGATETAFDANSWDMVQAYDDEIHFFKNDMEIRKSTVAHISHITALAYDSVNRTLYISEGWTIRSGAVEENLDSELTFDRILHEGDSYAHSMVFDPVTKTLFWDQGKSLMKMEVASYGIDSSPKISELLNSTYEFDLTLDICHRFLYWINVGGNSIERSRLDGTDRKVILSDSPSFFVGFYDFFYGLTVDHYGGKLYFGITGDHLFKIEEINLDGSDGRVFVLYGTDNESVLSRLAVDATALYWTAGRAAKSRIWKVYKNGTAMRAIEELGSLTHNQRTSTILTRHSVEGVDCTAILDREQVAARLEQISNKMDAMDARLVTNQNQLLLALIALIALIAPIALIALIVKIKLWCSAL